MNLKDQVLSIVQVRELQELGFDVNKHSSLKSNGKQIIVQDDFYIGGAPLFPTMTIGDIIEVLPNRINIERFLFRLEINNPSVYYTDRIKNTGIYFYNKGLIDNLFETLKWCIEEKHIEL